MYLNKRIAAVIPAHNEERQIAGVINTMPDFVDDIVVIDDASSDGTAQVVRGLLAEEPRLVLLGHEANQGVGGAIATGYEWARDKDVDVAVVMAGDGQMAPADLPAILAPVVLGTADYAKGNRLVSGEAYHHIPKLRYFGNATLSLLTKIASGYWQVADSQSGYAAINKAALRAIDWRRMYKRYGQPNDLLVRLNVEGFRVCDVRIKPVYNIGEKSDLKVPKVILPISWLLLKLFLWRLKEKYIIRDFHPLIFFYALSAMMGLVNIAFFVRLILLWPRLGQVPEITFLIWMFSASTGMMSAFFAMWLDMQYNAPLNVRGKCDGAQSASSSADAAPSLEDKGD